MILKSLKGGFSEINKKYISLALLPVALLAVFYAGGYLAQLFGNYAAWKQAGGYPGDGSSPRLASPDFVTCISAVFRPPYGVYGILLCAVLFILLLVLVMRLGYNDSGEYDRERNFAYSKKGTYGTSGWMGKKEAQEIFDLTSDLMHHHGVILGVLGDKAVCVPDETRLNRNMAVFGSSGSMKTRSYCINRILQGIAAGESLIITDPKAELYEKTSAYAKEAGCIVRIFNLVNPEHSDSWQCLKEIGGDELMAQIFAEIVIKNSNDGSKGDRFFDAGEKNLWKALCLYVDMLYPEGENNIGQAYQLMMNPTQVLNSLFDVLPITHPARASYSFFRNAPSNVQADLISGLGTRLQILQSKAIREITSHGEIDLELPGKKQCVYYLVTSDQDSTYDFLASLFLSFAFIRLIRYADTACKGGKLPVPVHILGEELLACGTIPDLAKKSSVIRSRNVSLSCVFQNLAGLQNRYPQNQWQEILGNSDIQLFLGCTDQLTAEYISSRTGIASVAVSSKSKHLGTWQISDYTPDYRETSGVGKRPVLTPDEVMRLPVHQALVIARGQKVLRVEKMDYTRHPDYCRLHDSSASEHIPEWKRKNTEQAAGKRQPEPKQKKKRGAAEKKGNGNDAGEKKPAAPSTQKPENHAAEEQEKGGTEKGGQSRYTVTDKKSILSS